MNIASIALSGIRAARTGIQYTSQNISNLSTYGYRKWETNFSEMEYGGVSATPVRTGSDYMDIQLRNANIENDSAETRSYAYTQLSQIPTGDIRSAYATLEEASVLRLNNPGDPFAQEAYDQALQGFENSVNRYRSALNQFMAGIQNQLQLAEQRAGQIQEQIERAMENGISDPEEIKEYQSQYIAESARIDDYRTVLNDIISPVRQVFENAVANVTDAQDLNNGLSQMESIVGYLAQDADRNLEFTQNRLQNIESHFGVDIVEEQVKLMQYQRMYEANAKVLKVSDELVGTILNIMA